MNTIKYLFTIIFISTSFNLAAQNEDKTDKELRIKNKIKEVCTYNHSINYNDSTIINKSVYDLNGNLSKSYSFYEGKLSYTYVPQYQNELLVKEFMYYKNDSLFYTLTYDYDERGNQTDYKQTSTDGTLEIFQRRKYNEKNQLTEFYSKKEKGDSLFLEHKYYYNNEGYNSKIETFDETGKLIIEGKLIYNKKGKLITRYETESNLSNRTHTYIYNKKNLLVESNHKIINNETIRGIQKLISSTRKLEWKYDSEDNMVEESFFENDYLSAKTTFFYTKF